MGGRLQEFIPVVSRSMRKNGRSLIFYQNEDAFSRIIRGNYLLNDDRRGGS
jgi:hypothetical protein